MRHEKTISTGSPRDWTEPDGERRHILASW
jgi:hypothetical protein